MFDRLTPTIAEHYVNPSSTNGEAEYFAENTGGFGLPSSGFRLGQSQMRPLGPKIDAIAQIE